MPDTQPEKAATGLPRLIGAVVEGTSIRHRLGKPWVSVYVRLSNGTGVRISGTAEVVPDDD